jgi:hypothetical protein
MDGGPLYRRAQAQDRKIIDDLNQIKNSLNMYYSSEHLLPQSLKDITTSLNVDISKYEYIKTDESLYELCANFKTDTSAPVGSEKPPYQTPTYLDPFAHKKGHQCLSFSANDLGYGYSNQLPTPTMPPVPSTCKVVDWINKVGVTAKDDQLVKTQQMKEWTAGANSAETLTENDSVGSVIYTVDKKGIGGNKMIGLGSGVFTGKYEEIDFALELQEGGGIRIHEKGNLVSDQPTNFRSGDRFKISVDKKMDKTIVRWYKNGVEFYTDDTPTVKYPLSVEASLYTPQVSIDPVYLCIDPPKK